MLSLVMLIRIVMVTVMKMEMEMVMAIVIVMVHDDSYGCDGITLANEWGHCFLIGHAAVVPRRFCNDLNTW